MTVPALAIRHLSKHFGSFVANEDISLEVFPGEIHAVVGENGAGKSTLMKCLYGLHRPSSGSLAVRGTDVTVDSPRTANRLGIGMVHQHFMLVPSFPVYRNVVLGAEPGTWDGSTKQAPSGGWRSSPPPFISPWTPGPPPPRFPWDSNNGWKFSNCSTGAQIF